MTGRHLSSPRPGVALVTGASRRIGRTIALELARAGWDIGLHCRACDSDADSAAADIRGHGRRVALLAGDLADIADVQGLVPRLAREIAAPTLLVNCASMFVYDEIATLDPAQWNAHLAANLTAPVLLAQAFAAHLPAGAHGNIVNIIDQRVWKPTPHFFSYTASKAGLWAVTRTLAQALAPAIRVNAIGPGPVLESVHQAAGEFEAQNRALLLGHGTTPAEIAAAIRFILDAPAMTGQMIALDGGQHLAWQTPDIGNGRG